MKKLLLAIILIAIISCATINGKEIFIWHFGEGSEENDTVVVVIEGGPEGESIEVVTPTEQDDDYDAK